jgi:putative transposase
MTKRDPFTYFKTSPETNGLAVVMYVQFPLCKRRSNIGLQKRLLDAVVAE